MKKFDVIACLLLIIGGINWGLIGIFNFNVISYIVGETWLDRVIYVLIGFAAIYQALGWKAIQNRWK